MGVGLVVLAGSAGAQARGTLQVSATVVDTRVSAQSLAVVKRALQIASAPLGADSVAVIRIERREDAGRLVLVTIDYSRN